MILQMLFCAQEYACQCSKLIHPVISFHALPCACANLKCTRSDVIILTASVGPGYSDCTDGPALAPV